MNINENRFRLENSPCSPDDTIALLNAVDDLAKTIIDLTVVLSLVADPDEPETIGMQEVEKAREILVKWGLIN